MQHGLLRALTLLAFIGLVLVSAHHCDAGGEGFIGSLQMSFESVQPLAAGADWFETKAAVVDPQQCDNNHPQGLFPTSSVCPSDNFGVTSSEACPDGCMQGTCKGGCGTDAHGACAGQYFDCGYMSQLRWGTPAPSWDPYVANENVKAGFAFAGNQSQPLTCGRNILIGDFVHLNWNVRENPTPEAALRFDLNIPSLQNSPLSWTWRVMQYETQNHACDDQQFPDCCQESIGFCPYGGNPCAEGCADIVGFYEVPYQQFHSLRTTDSSDSCVYDVTIWMLVSRSELCVPGLNPPRCVNGWIQSKEQCVNHLPVYVNLLQRCGSETPGPAPQPPPPISGECTSVGQPCGPTSSECIMWFCNSALQCEATAAPANSPCQLSEQTECMMALCNEQGECEQHYLEGFPCVGQFPPPSAENNYSLCLRPICEGAQCVLHQLPAGADCSPPNTTCEQWVCSVDGLCLLNSTTCPSKRPSGSHTWVAVGAAAGVAFLLAGLAALGIARMFTSSPVPQGGQVDQAGAASHQSPIYHPMGNEGVNPLYATGPAP